MLIRQARAGSDEALGELLEGCRQYLLLIANKELNTQVRPKSAASDLVQQTFVDAVKHFYRFDGNTSDELIAWLRCILQNNHVDVQRRYLRSQKRNLAREKSRDAESEVARRANAVNATDETPSECVVKQEESNRLYAVMEQLPAESRKVLRLRHLEQMTFVQIGELMNRSPDAARMLWFRAFERLSKEMERISEAS